MWGRASEGVKESLNNGGSRVLSGRTEESLAGDVVSLGHWVSSVVLDVDGLPHRHSQL